jgi:hypothetical protein
MWLMSHGTQHYNGPAQGYNEVYNADLLSPFLPTTAQLIAPHRLARVGTKLVGNSVAHIDESGSYLGIPLLVLAVYFVCRYWRRLWFIFCALMSVSIFVFSLGPRLYVDGRHRNLSFNLPFEKINHLPIVENILPVRLSLYVMFFVAIILAMGIDAMYWDRQRRSVHRPGRTWTGRVALGALGLAAVVSLLPAWPYHSYVAVPNRAETAQGLAVIPNNAVVLTYPYAAPNDDPAMLWQALSGMRFKLIGGYALIPYGKKGHASNFPSLLQPLEVQSILANSISCGHTHVRPPVCRRDSLKIPSFPVKGFSALVATKTTITPARVQELRTFVHHNHITAAIVELGRMDSSVIAYWFKAAFGLPTRAGAGGMIWTNLQSVRT